GGGVARGRSRGGGRGGHGSPRGWGVGLEGRRSEARASDGRDDRVHVGGLGGSSGPGAAGGVGGSRGGRGHGPGREELRDGGAGAFPRGRSWWSWFSSWLGGWARGAAVRSEGLGRPRRSRPRRRPRRE